MGQDQLLGKIVTMACFDSGSHEFVPRAQSAGFGAVSQSLKGCNQVQHSLYLAPGRRTALMRKAICTLDSVLLKAVFKTIR